MMNNESGRSMVEMLGVLAIIGVLSVTGIAGYSMAMRAYRANEDIQAASLLYAVARSANGGLGVTPATTGAACFAALIGGTKPAGVNDICYTADNQVTITVADASAKDADAIRNKIGTAGVVTAGGSGTSVTLTYNNS